MTGVRGRPPGLGPTSGGKKKNTKNIRPMGTAEIREAIRQDIIAVWQRLGQGEWLYELALKEPLFFLTHCWSRIAPPIPKEADVVNQLNVSINNMSSLEKARRVAFLLASAEQALLENQPGIIDYPSQAELDKENFTRAVEAAKAEPVDYPMPHEQVEPEPKEVSIETYYGSSAEHGHGHGKKRNLI